jgi:hypothetical protein
MRQYITHVSHSTAHDDRLATGTAKASIQATLGKGIKDTLYSIANFAQMPENDAVVLTYTWV